MNGLVDTLKQAAFDADLLAFYVVVVLITVGGLLLVGFVGACIFTLFTLPSPLLPFRGGPQKWGLAVEHVQIGDGTAWFVPHPTSERVVILVHGHNRSKHWMLPIMQSISPHVNVLAIDLPSHGSMWPGICGFGLKEASYVNDAVVWAEKRGFYRALLAGHSMGGSTSIIANVIEPHEIVDGVMTIGSFGSIEHVFIGVADTLGLPEAFGRFVLGTCSRLSGFDYADGAPLDLIGMLDVPYVAMHGKRDMLVPPSEAHLLASEAGSSSSLIWYDGGHDEPQNPAIPEAILRFVQVLDEKLPAPTFH